MNPLPPGQPERRAGKVDQALANTERLTNLIKIVGLALAIYIAIAVTVASFFGITNSVRSVDHAAKAEKFALQARNQAKVNEGIGKNVQELVAAQGPCKKGDPPESPSCVRDARTTEAVNNVIAAIEMHDLNTRAAHELLAQVRRSTITLPRRTSITTPPRTTTTRVAVTTTRTTMPPTTTTTCPKRGNTNKCR